jgi:hypothetical protein
LLSYIFYRSSRKDGGSGGWAGGNDVLPPEAVRLELQSSKELQKTVADSLVNVVKRLTTVETDIKQHLITMGTDIKSDVDKAGTSSSTRLDKLEEAVTAVLKSLDNVLKRLNDVETAVSTVSDLATRITNSTDKLPSTSSIVEAVSKVLNTHTTNITRSIENVPTSNAMNQVLNMCNGNVVTTLGEIVLKVEKNVGETISEEQKILGEKIIKEQKILGEVIIQEQKKWFKHLGKQTTAFRAFTAEHFDRIRGETMEKSNQPAESSFAYSQGACTSAAVASYQLVSGQADVAQSYQGQVYGHIVHPYPYVGQQDQAAFTVSEIGEH